ncbi:cytochrome c oxidase subunit II [Paralimibaculum aggregatum]|nr:cytochrome c oxidase subunit II [Limibaculum sp. NKW23]
MRKLAPTVLAAAAALAALPALGQEPTGKPHALGTGLQRPVTSHAADLVWLDDMLLVIIGVIVVFVTGLMAYTIWRYRESRNPEPETFTHNAAVEVVWTAVPVLILVVIAIPSLRLLDAQMTVPTPELTIKATGNQWYWDYEYPDEGIEMSAYMIGSPAMDGQNMLTDEVRAQLKEYGYSEDEFLLATDTRIVVPADTNVHLLVTGADVIHNWAMPAFGIKIDAIPGRINEAWFNVSEPGTYFGQCSELCGLAHAYMPIVVEVVPQEEYDAWVAEQVARREESSRVAQAPAVTAAD